MANENGDEHASGFRVPVYRSPRKPTPISSNITVAQQGIQSDDLERIHVFLQSYGMPSTNGFDLKRISRFVEYFDTTEPDAVTRLNDFMRLYKANEESPMLTYEKFLDMYKYVFNL